MVGSKDKHKEEREEGGMVDTKPVESHNSAITTAKESRREKTPQSSKKSMKKVSNSADDSDHIAKGETSDTKKTNDQEQQQQIPSSNLKRKLDSSAEVEVEIERNDHHQPATAAPSAPSALKLNGNHSNPSKKPKSSPGRQAKNKDTNRNKDKDLPTTIALPSNPSKSNDKHTVLSILRCRFVKWSIHSVCSMAVSEPAHAHGSLYLAVARTNGNVEIRTSRLAYQVECWVTGNTKNPVTGMQFVEYDGVKKVQNRGNERKELYLWISRLDGSLTLFHVLKQKQAVVLYPGGGAIWNIKAYGRDVAIGSEDGSVRHVQCALDYTQPVKSLLDDSEEFPILTSSDFLVRMSGAGQSRVVSLAWSPDGASLYAGDCSGSIRQIDVSSMTTTTTMMASEKYADTVIWSLAFLDLAQPNTSSSTNTLISGDSRGIVSIWDISTGTCESEISVENGIGDMFALAPCFVEGIPTVFVGSANGGVGLMQKASSGNWVTHRSRVIHSGDVRGMVFSKKRNLVFSGGNDSSLTYFAPTRFLQQDPVVRLFPCTSPALSHQTHVNADTKTIMGHTDNEINFWKVSDPGRAPQIPPQMILCVKPANLGGNITCCAVSSNMQYLAVAGPLNIRLYSLKLVTDDVYEVKLVGVLDKDEIYQGVKSIVARGEDSFVCISRTGDSLFTVYVQKPLDDSGTSVIAMGHSWNWKELIEELKLADKRLDKDIDARYPFVTRIGLNATGSMMAVGDSRGRVVVLHEESSADNETKKKKKKKKHGDKAVPWRIVDSMTPKRHDYGFVSSLCFHPTMDLLAIATCPTRVFIYTWTTSKDNRPVALRLLPENQQMNQDEKLTYEFRKNWSSSYAVTSMHFLPAKGSTDTCLSDQRLVLEGHNRMMIMENAGTQQKPRSESSTPSTAIRLRSIEHAGNVLGSGILSHPAADNTIPHVQLVLIEIPWSQVVPTLPPVISRKVFREL